jgi:hypothetical protein
VRDGGRMFTQEQAVEMLNLYENLLNDRNEQLRSIKVDIISALIKTAALRDELTLEDDTINHLKR